MKSQRVTHTIEPVYDEHSEILILGTMPSPKSREVGFYYGHPRNRFWPVMGALFDEPTPTTNQRRTDLLLRHHIALWDVLAQCDIEGASDASIDHAVPNDLRRIQDAAPIQAVFCTGAKSAALYRRLCEPTAGLPCVQLPSTSPANASWSTERLVEAYRAILPHLTPEPTQILTVPEVVALEQQIAAAGTSLAELMDRAGLWLAYRTHQLRPEGRAVILCGNGNNGGDGWVAARHLAAWGHGVTIVCAKPAAELRAEPARSAALTTEAGAEDAGIEIHVAPSPSELEKTLAPEDIIIDAILGTGFSGESVKEPFATWIELANARRQQGATVVAADVPSGLSAQTGAAAHTTIQADETVTMIASKVGLTTPDAARYAGKVTVAPLACLR